MITSKKPCVYLCGPIVQDEKMSRAWREEATKQLTSCDIDVRDPCRGKNWGDVHSCGMDTKNPLFANGRFVHRDTTDIRQSDVVLFYWPGEPGRQSIGSFMELGMAVALGKPIVVVCSNESVVALHPFITELCVSPFLWGSFDTEKLNPRRFDPIDQLAGLRTVRSCEALNDAIDFIIAALTV